MRTCNITHKPQPRAVAWPAAAAYFEVAAHEQIAWYGPSAEALPRWTGVEIECLMEGLSEMLAENERERSARCPECGAEEDACEHNPTGPPTPLSEATRRVFAHWRVSTEGDGSLDADGIEIRTAPARGAAFLRQIGALTYVVRRYEEARVDNSCGLHVHVDAEGLYGEDIAWMLQAWRAVQPAAMMMVSIERRRGSYCRPLRMFPPLALLLQRDRGIARALAQIVPYRQVDAVDESSADQYPDCPSRWRDAWALTDDACRASVSTALQVDVRRRAQRYDSARYYALNLHSLNHHRTIEFRLAPGTLQAEKITGWAQLWNALLTWSYHRRAVARAVERLHHAYSSAADHCKAIDQGFVVAARTLYHDVPSRLSPRLRASIRDFIRARWEKCGWGWWCDWKEKILEESEGD